MNNKILFTLVVGTLTLPVWAQGYNPHDAKIFSGLWCGVDPNDGGKRTVSITDLEKDGVFEVVARDTFWGPCEGELGVAHSTGQVGVDENGIAGLVVEGVLTCHDETVEPVEFTTTYESDTMNRLIEHGRFTPILHRVNE